jgi:hypothetical protein
MAAMGAAGMLVGRSSWRQTIIVDAVFWSGVDGLILALNTRELHNELATCLTQCAQCVCVHLIRRQVSTRPLRNTLLLLWP